VDLEVGHRSGWSGDRGDLDYEYEFQKLISMRGSYCWKGYEALNFRKQSYSAEGWWFLGNQSCTGHSCRRMNDEKGERAPRDQDGAEGWRGLQVPFVEHCQGERGVVRRNQKTAGVAVKIAFVLTGNSDNSRLVRGCIEDPRLAWDSVARNVQ
jgi:hypothetical protein